jgi:hypothetical protein
MENVLPALPEYVTLAVRQCLSFRYDKVPIHCGKISDSFEGDVSRRSYEMPLA